MAALRELVYDTSWLLAYNPLFQKAVDQQAANWRTRPVSARPQYVAVIFTRLHQPQPHPTPARVPSTPRKYHSQELTDKSDLEGIKHRIIGGILAWRSLRKPPCSGDISWRNRGGQQPASKAERISRLSGKRMGLAVAINRYLMFTDDRLVKSPGQDFDGCTTTKLWSPILVLINDGKVVVKFQDTGQASDALDFVGSFVDLLR
jgi:hypothetical protein